MRSKIAKKMLGDTSLKTKLEVIIISEVRILMKKLGYEDSDLTTDNISEIQESVNNIIDSNMKNIGDLYDENEETLSELKDFAHEICPNHRNDDLADILEKFK